MLLGFFIDASRPRTNPSKMCTSRSPPARRSGPASVLWRDLPIASNLRPLANTSGKRTGPGSWEEENQLPRNRGLLQGVAAKFQEEMRFATRLHYLIPIPDFSWICLQGSWRADLQDAGDRSEKDREGSFSPHSERLDLG